MPPYTFREDDTLDGIAVRHRLNGWRDIWDLPGNAALRNRRHGDTWRLRPGDVLEVPQAATLRDRVLVATGLAHRFQARAVAAVRLVSDGGHPRARASDVRRILQISTLVANQNLPTGFLGRSTDRRNFKIEVVDPGVGGASPPAASALLEILMPGRFVTLAAASTVAEIASREGVEDPATIRNHARNAAIWAADPALTSVPAGTVVWVPRDGDPLDFNPPRQIVNVPLRRVPGTDVFRSRYLRLVVDDRDDAAVANQTLLADWNPNEPDVDILGQIVRVRYTSASGEIIATRAQVGEGPIRARLAIHVLRPAPGGQPVVPLDTVRREVRTWFRRVYAQANLAPKIEALEDVDPVENLISIGNRNGAEAAGHSHIRLTIHVTPAAPGAAAAMIFVPDVPVQAHATPEATANSLAAAIRAAAAGSAFPGLVARVVVNAPPAQSRLRGRSADVVLTDPSGARITIDGLHANDSRQRVLIGRVNVARLRGMGDGTLELNTGSPQERALLHAYRRSVDHLDVFIVRRMQGSDLLGEALTRWIWPTPARRSIPEVANSVFFGAEAVNGHGTDPYTFSHEVGHVLLDAGHTSGQRQLMRRFSGNGHGVAAPKRMSDSALRFTDPPPRFVQQERIRAVGGTLLAPFD